MRRSRTTRYDLPVDELREELYRLSYHGLEQCVRRLLQDLGYHSVAVLTRTHRRQRTSHGGFDLIAKSEAGLTKDSLIVQIKQYERPVSRRFVDELRGAMLRTGVGHGLLITLGSFPLPAHKAAESSPIAPIRLVDGAELAMLFIFKGIGVREARSGRITVDRRFFASVRDTYPRPGRTRLSMGQGKANTRWSGANPTRKGGDMLYRTHALIAVNSLWFLTPIPGAVTGSNIGLLAVLAAVGAMLPDLDARNSTVRHLSVKGIQPFVPFASVLNRAWGHRGPLHSLAGLLAVAAATGLLASLWAWRLSAALMLGYASHLAADACTVTGIPLWPGRSDRWHLLPKRFRFVTGSLAEDALLPLLAAAVLLLFLTHPAIPDRQ
jgi:inner membrane protein